MRFVIVNLLCLALLSMEPLFFIASNELGKSILPIHAYAHDKHDQRILLAFRSLEKIDPDATYTEIAAIAKDRFGEHPHADKWTELCFLLRRDEKGTISELRRFAELEIQILTDIDAEKHSEAIEAYQGALKELDDLSTMFQKQGIPIDVSQVTLPLGEDETPDSHLDQWEEAALKHHAKFKILKETDPAEARIQLLEIAKIRFGLHPLTDEWIPLYFRLSRDGNGRISDIIRFAELEIRMLTDLNVENYKEQIQQHRKTLKKYDQLIKTLKSQGKNPDTVIVDF